jgi:hypothetical protein
MADRRQALKAELSALERMKFPPGSSNDEVDQLRAELAEYDGVVNGLARRVLAGDEQALTLLRPDDSLRTRLRALHDSAHDLRRETQPLLDYLDQLEAVVHAATGPS